MSAIAPLHRHKTRECRCQAPNGVGQRRRLEVAKDKDGEQKGSHHIESTVCSPTKGCNIVLTITLIQGTKAAQLRSEL